jgi:hypothetical protein
MLRGQLLGWLLMALAGPAAADEPLSPPSDYKTDSPNGRCYAFLNARQRKTTVFEQNRGGAPRPLWEMPGWFRVVSLANDCEHLVIGFDGSNLLPLDFKPDMLLLSFYWKGKLLRSVRLNEVIRDTSRLTRTVSHYYWGRFLGMDDHGRYLIETVEGRRITFDISTGQEIAGRK